MGIAENNTQFLRQFHKLISMKILYKPFSKGVIFVLNISQNANL